MMISRRAIVLFRKYAIILIMINLNYIKLIWSKLYSLL